MEERFIMHEEAPAFLLLDGAEGAIEPHADQQEKLEELTHDVQSGRFHAPTEGYLPCKCIDGRSCTQPTVGPNAAGGTETLFVADDLTTRRYAAEDGSVAGGMRKLTAELRGKGLPVGGHSDDHHTDPAASGCGANDKLPQIYDMITRKPEVIQRYVEAILGDGSVDRMTAELIVQNAGQRTAFSDGKEVLDTLTGSDGARVEQLEGTHKEVVAAINWREGTSLDRVALSDEYGSDYQAFNIDAWSFVKAAEETSISPQEARQKVIAMTYYNVATALVLCGPHLRVVVVK